MKTKLFITAAVFVAMAAITSAQTAQQTPGQVGRGRAAGNVWVDANKNDVCDNYENGTRMGRRAYSAGNNQTAVNRGPGRGQGQGMYAAQGYYAGQGRAQGRGPAMTAGRGIGRATGYAPGRGRFNGRGPAFIDTNNDGICDDLQVATPPTPVAPPAKK